MLIKKKNKKVKKNKSNLEDHNLLTKIKKQNQLEKKVEPVKKVEKSKMSGWGTELKR